MAVSYSYSQDRGGKRYWALKTNLPLDAVAIQNLSLEVGLHDHWSISFPVIWSVSEFKKSKSARGLAFQPECRWWMDEVGSGHFLGMHTHFAWYNVKWKDDRYQSGKRPLMGVGVNYGYTLPLTNHLRAECTIGAGYANMKYDTYYNVDNGSLIDTRINHYWGITQAGLSLVYVF